MDSTPRLHQPLKPSASKLPIKRKTPFPQHPHQQQLVTPKLELQPQPLSFSPLDGSPPKPKPPPFKFHRVWTEPDEMSFLQGLLQSHSLSFPKDLTIFYSNFAKSISQPYTKSQLSEKLRRLRKKFRVISSRLAQGLDPSALSAHDQALFDLSKRLWSPEFASTSPFGKNSSGFNLGFSQDQENNCIDGNCFDECDIIDNDGEMKINDVNVNYDFGGGRDEVIKGEAIYGIVAKSVLDVFDECFKEVRMVFEKQGVVWMDAMERRWKEQRVSEFDVLARRLRLVIENSLTRR
ncbi:hypothetical protein DITRI_Ditri13aG0163600 [Diplodiscus trichospermus]